MEDNRFFRFLWRSNAVFLFVAGISLIGVLLMAFTFILTDLLGREDTPPPSVSETVEKSETLTIANPSETLKLSLPRSNQNADGFAYFELRSGIDSYGKLSSGSSSQRRNIAAFNLETNETHWVFPNAQQEIEQVDNVARKITLDNGKTDYRTTGFLLTVATSRADKSVTRDLWIMSPDGKDARKILTDISRSPQIKTYGNDQKKLILETKTHIDVYPFDIDTLTLGQVTKITLP